MIMFYIFAELSHSNVVKPSGHVVFDKRSCHTPGPVSIYRVR